MVVSILGTGGGARPDHVTALAAGSMTLAVQAATGICERTMDTGTFLQLHDISYRDNEQLAPVETDVEIFLIAICILC
jgi:hypothetical protein